MKAGTQATSIETGVIANVNVKNLTVDWASQYSGKQIPDVQIMSPYVHFNNGEGFTCIPEVGAICVLCIPSDGDPPFIMGFLTAPELEGADFSKFLEEKLVDPGVESEEDIDKENTTSAGGSTEVSTNPTDASFRGGRPILNPGDMYWQGRDENFVVLRRGGVLQLGATQICQRAYIPLLNFIRDFSENYELNTAAGSLSWTVQRQENDPAGNAPTEFEIVAREYAQDKKASIKVSIGSLDDATKPPGGDKSFIEVTIAPQQIDAASGEVSGKAKYVLRLDKAGNSFVFQSATRTEEVGGDYKLTVHGDREVVVDGSETVRITGDQGISTKKHTLTAQESSENISGTKTLSAFQLLLGSSAASQPGVLGLRLVTWLASHTHKVPALPNPDLSKAIPSLPPEPVGQALQILTDSVLSKTVKLS